MLPVMNGEVEVEVVDEVEEWRSKEAPTRKRE